MKIVIILFIINRKILDYKNESWSLARSISSISRWLINNKEYGFVDVIAVMRGPSHIFFFFLLLQNKNHKILTTFALFLTFISHVSLIQELISNPTPHLKQPFLPFPRCSSQTGNQHGNVPASQHSRSNPPSPPQSRHVSMLISSQGQNRNFGFAYKWLSAWNQREKKKKRKRKKPLSAIQ